MRRSALAATGVVIAGVAGTAGLATAIGQSVHGSSSTDDGTVSYSGQTRGSSGSNGSGQSSRGQLGRQTSGGQSQSGTGLGAPSGGGSVSGGSHGS